MIWVCAVCLGDPVLIHLLQYLNFRQAKTRASEIFQAILFFDEV